MLEDIHDETILSQVMEDVAFYSGKKDVIETLTPQQLEELDAAIKEADNNETTSWEDFKKEMTGWKQK